MSNYDNAVKIYAETLDAEQALACFNPYTEKSAIVAFCYKVLDALNVRFKNRYGCLFIELMFEYDEDDDWCQYTSEYCLG